MYVNSVSSVRFMASPQSREDVEKILNRPQTFQKAPQATVVVDDKSAPKKKSHKFAKVLAGTLATVAVAAIGLALLKKTNVTTVLPDLTDASLMQKVSHYAGVAGQKILDVAATCKDAVLGLINRFRSAAPATPDTPIA